MKKYLVISILTLAACNGSSSNSTNNSNHLPTSMVNNPNTAGGMDTIAAEKMPTMDFKDTLHDFGTIHPNEVVTYEFAFTNNGKTPLIINNAYGSCGCTVPEYPHDPVAPGTSGIIRVSFNSAGKSGHQAKTVTIRTNTLKNVHMLYISSDISKD